MNIGSEKLPPITPDELLNKSVYSPADNVEGYETNVPYLSRFFGGIVRYWFQYKNILGTMSQMPLTFGPASYGAAVYKELIEMSVTSHIRRHSEVATEMGRNPDIFVEHDDRIEQAYAQLLYDFSGEFISNGTFNKKRAKEVATSIEGQVYLRKKVIEFGNLEACYYSLGLTALKAMKELLLSLLIAVTEQLPEKEALPYAKLNQEGNLTISGDEYLQGLRKRIENLYNNDAFHIKWFSERVTEGKIGYCPYEIVEDSKLGPVTLRYYLCGEDVKKNNKVLYLASPLINMPEIYDLAEGKSVIEPLLAEGYEIYLVDNGNPGPEYAELDLSFYTKTVHDTYLDIIKKRHPNKTLYAMGYCMGGTLLMPYLARRAQERLLQGKTLDIKKVALAVAPIKFDDSGSGHGVMRGVISGDYDLDLMKEMYGAVNIPPQIIEVGMNEIQPGVRYFVRSGFYSRASIPGAIEDSAPFFYWLTHGTKFASQAHSEWITKLFVENQLYNNCYSLPSTNPELDGKPVDMNILEKVGLVIFDYRGKRDPISPSGSCLSSELWGAKSTSNISDTKNGLNRTIEKNVGHIFVVSKTLLGDFIKSLTDFFDSKDITN